MVEASLKAARPLSLLCALLALAGCADQAKRRDGELQELVGLLAGRYDNIAQVRTEAAAGGAQRESLLLAIVPVYAPLIGDNVFYLQESAASDPRRVITQQLLSLQVSNGEPLLIETQLALADPARWREGSRNPDVFKSLLQQDVKLQNGCEITWHKVPGGFDGATDVARCRTSSRSTGEALRVDLRLQLRDDTLHLTERQLDATGVVVQGGGADTGTLFQRRAD
jgi:hypothetical protein